MVSVTELLWHIDEAGLGYPKSVKNGFEASLNVAFIHFWHFSSPNDADPSLMELFNSDKICMTMQLY